MNELEFIEALKEHNIILNETQIKQFSLYFDLLKEYNKVMDLTSVKDDEIYERHFYNSLLIAFNNNFDNLSLCDVGSGAGFPAIPLKIVFPNMKLTIIDSLGKRMNFLEIVVQKLNLSDVTLVNDRVENVALIYKENFDVVTARAVARLNILLELCAQLVKIDGTFIAMKGEKGLEELKEANKALKTLNMELINTEEFNPSINLYFKKEKAIDNKYPRSYSLIKNKPL